MPGHSSTLESFLTEFHNARPGLTSKAFGALPVLFREHEFPSSYEVLSAVVPRGAATIDVLDLACGDGYLLSLLASRSQPGLTLSGVDMSSSELSVARARLPTNITLRQAKAKHLPFRSGSFDYVLCHMALMLMDDAECVLREIHHVLKPDAAFAAIVGAAPPPSPAFTAYVETLSRYPRQAHLSEVRFGDRRFRSAEGIAEILSPAFVDVVVEDIHITRRLKPDDLWRRFLDMYDLYLLTEVDRRTVAREYLSAVGPLCPADGMLEYRETLRYVSARAA